jgi:hypothetical protein
MAIEIGEHSCRRKTDGICICPITKARFFGFSAIWHLNEELALMVLSCLSPCSHLELSIGDHGGSGFAMKLLVAWKTWCNTWVSSVNIYCRPWWF